ncbi:hypothetical protein [Actinokineospora sp. NBRC 105648]|uniref:hypothetical protein n=1 Tax=Actinokineospora sp. NBRC 105648 TaxID=3032206 RepID=UPI0024A5CB0B|nr:hypothetical protein [Actinokineospora sp. NBRC 105648]GLZ38047.1 hypothetical protein Acsp05_16710 [Actinokineospora sp. NBRC 105648]
MIKRMAMAAAVCAVSLSAAVTPAAAVGNGVDPVVTAIREPLSGQVVDEWRLAGRASASGVQVAPEWVLTTRHAPGRVGGTFANAYGTATIDAVTSCVGNSCDLSVSHLTTAIPAPAFPDLVESGILEHDLTYAGNTLVVGLGGGKLTAAWTTPGGNPELASLAAPPTAIPGDSGGPAFYHRPGDPTGHLVGLMTYGAPNPVTGVPEFTPDHRDFITGVVGTAVRWTTVDGLGPRPDLPASITDFTATATSTSVRLSWNPATSSPPVSAYTAVLVNPADAADRKLVRTTATMASFDVPTGARWGAFVLPENANGLARVPAGFNQSGDQITYQYSRYVAAGPPPTAVNPVEVTSSPGALRVRWTRGPGAVEDVNHTLTRLCAGTDPQCANPITQLDTTITAADLALPAGAVYGDRFVVSTRDANLAGPAPEVRTTVHYLPLRPPTAPRTLTARVTDAQLVLSWDTRNDFQPTLNVPLTRYRQHATPDLYSFYYTDPQGRRRTLDTVEAGAPPVLSRVLDSRFPPGRYVLEIVPRSWSWGLGPATKVTVDIGAPATFEAASVVPPAPRVAIPSPLTWLEAAPTPAQAPVESYIVVERVSGRVFEFGPEVRSFAHGVTGRQEWVVIAANQAYGQSAVPLSPSPDSPK